MDKNIKIRKVTKEDGFGWYTLTNKVWRYAYKDIFPEEVFIDNENRFEDRVKHFKYKMTNDHENIAYVAEYNGKIIGVMCGSINSSYEHFNDYADLIALYIDPDYHNMGIGTEFKNIFEKWAKSNDATKYVIGVLKDNQEARKVYESWGGKLSKNERDFIKLDVRYKEVFYTYDL